jgi:hypothetical protein
VEEKTLVVQEGKVRVLCGPYTISNNVITSEVFLHYSFITFQPYTIICNDIICFSTARLTKRQVHYFVSLFLSIIMDPRKKRVLL